MALVSPCDNCQDEWVVDALTYVEAVEKVLCPVCVNQLVDLCWSRLNNATIHQIKVELEDM